MIKPQDKEDPQRKMKINTYVRKQQLKLSNKKSLNIKKSKKAQKM